jgi:hypothetical protein
MLSIPSCEGNSYRRAKRVRCRGTFNPRNRGEGQQVYRGGNSTVNFQPPHKRGELVSHYFDSRRKTSFQPPHKRRELVLAGGLGRTLLCFQPLPLQGCYPECTIVVARDFSIPSDEGRLCQHTSSAICVTAFNPLTNEGNLYRPSTPCLPSWLFNPLTNEGNLYLEICKLLKLAKNRLIWHQLCKLAPNKE